MRILLVKSHVIQITKLQLLQKVMITDVQQDAHHVRARQIVVIRRNIIEVDDQHIIVAIVIIVIVVRVVHQQVDHPDLLLQDHIHVLEADRDHDQDQIPATALIQVEAVLEVVLIRQDREHDRIQDHHIRPDIQVHVLDQGHVRDHTLDQVHIGRRPTLQNPIPIPIPIPVPILDHALIIHVHGHVHGRVLVHVHRVHVPDHEVQMSL